MRRAISGDTAARPFSTRDKATRDVLWEGRGEGVAREGEAGLDNTAVATRLATALFAKFPEGTEVAALQP